MKPKKSELLDSYLRNEINKINFQYNSDHWEELRNNLDQIQVNNHPSFIKQNIFSKINKDVFFIFILTASLIFVYFLQSPSIMNSHHSNDETNVEYQAPANIDSKNSDEFISEDKAGSEIQKPLQNKNNSMITSDENSEIKLGADTLSNYPNNRSKSVLDSLIIKQENSIIKADSILLIPKKNVTAKDSTLLKPKKKKFIIWD